MRVELGENSYDIIIKRGVLSEISSYLDLNRKVLILTDDGVPEIYADAVKNACNYAVKVVIPQGEASKSIENLQLILDKMIEHNFSRADCLCAVGGGVCGDLGGFASSVYMRGVDFYNVPTTMLSQVDSSVGGKTAIDYNGIKNIIGAFKQPKRVIIDPDTLKTLPKRHINNGLCEALKMAATSDKELFELFENCDIYENLDTITEKSLLIKKSVVEQDEKEKNLRKILNFGHTIGHGIESVTSPQLYHGECVALGMLPMSAPIVRERLLKIYNKLGLITEFDFDKEKAKDAIKHDKKGNNGKFDAVYVNEAGKYEIKQTSLEELMIRMEETL